MNVMGARERRANSNAPHVPAIASSATNTFAANSSTSAVRDVPEPGRGEIPPHTSHPIHRESAIIARDSWSFNSNPV